MKKYLVILLGLLAAGSMFGAEKLNPLFFFDFTSDYNFESVAHLMENVDFEFCDSNKSMCSYKNVEYKGLKYSYINYYFNNLTRLTEVQLVVQDESTNNRYSHKLDSYEYDFRSSSWKIKNGSVNSYRMPHVMKYTLKVK